MKMCHYLDLTLNKERVIYGNILSFAQNITLLMYIRSRGILVTVFGLLYLYSKLAKHFGKLGKRGDTSDEDPKKN